MKRIGWAVTVVILGLAVMAADKTSDTPPDKTIDTTTPEAILTAMEKLESTKGQKGQTSLNQAEAEKAFHAFFIGKMLVLTGGVLDVTLSRDRSGNYVPDPALVTAQWKSSKIVVQERARGNLKYPKLTIKAQIPIKEDLARTIKRDSTVTLSGRIDHLDRRYDASVPEGSWNLEIVLQDGTVDKPSDAPPPDKRGDAATEAAKDMGDTTTKAILAAIEAIEKDPFKKDRTQLEREDLEARKKAAIEGFIGKKISLSGHVLSVQARGLDSARLWIQWQSSEVIVVKTKTSSDELVRNPAADKEKSDKYPKLTISGIGEITKDLARTIKMGSIVTLSGHIQAFDYDMRDHIIANAPPRTEDVTKYMRATWSASIVFDKDVTMTH